MLNCKLNEQNNAQSLGDSNFKATIYVQLTLSLYRTGQLEKCSYFAIKFLRQCVQYMTSDSSSSSSSSKSSIRHPHLVEFVGQLLNILRE